MSNLKNLKLCFLAGTLGQGGAERQLYYILKTLKETGAEPRVLCLTRGEYWEKKIEELGVPVAWVGQSKSRILRLIKIIIELAKNKPEIIQSHLFYCNLYAVMAARILGIREVGAIRSDTIHDVAAGGPRFGPLNLRLPRMIGVNSKTALENAVRAGAKRTRLFYLPNAVDTELFAPAEHTERRGYVHILGAGRMSPSKRFDRMLDILSAVIKKTSVPIRISIAGDGPVRLELEKQAASLGIADRVKFCGKKTDSEMADFYRRGDIFMLTSDYEGTPNVILEAMASGLPVLAVRAGDTPEIVEHGKSGFVEHSAQRDKIKQSLQKLIDEPNLRFEMASRARASVIRRYAFERLEHSLENLYGKILK